MAGKEIGIKEVFNLFLLLFQGGKRVTEDMYNEVWGR